MRDPSADPPHEGPHPADRRRPIEARSTEGLDEGRSAIAAANAADVRLALALVRIELDAAFAAEAASGAENWAVLNGLDSRRAKELLRLGRLFATVEGSRELVVSGELTPQTAAVVGDLLPARTGPVDREDPEFVALAQRVARFVDHAGAVSKKQLIDDVFREKEEQKQGEPLLRLGFLVKARVRDEWRLAARAARQKAGEFLSQGECFEHVVGDYLARHDIDGLSGKRATRVTMAPPECGDDPQGAVRAHTIRCAMERAKGHCEFPGCPYDTFLQIAHIRARARGGRNHLDNLVVLCGRHHTMLDHGLIRFVRRTPEGVVFAHMASGIVYEPDPRASQAGLLPGRFDDVERGDSEQPGADDGSPDHVSETRPAWGRTSRASGRRREVVGTASRGCFS